MITTLIIWLKWYLLLDFPSSNYSFSSHQGDIYSTRRQFEIIPHCYANFPKKIYMFSWARVFFFLCIKWAIIHDCDYLMVSSNYLQLNQWEAVQVECSHPAGVRHGCLSSSFLVAQDVPDSSFSRLFAANPCTKRRYDRNPNLAFPYCHIHFSGPSNGCG